MAVLLVFVALVLKDTEFGDSDTDWLEASVLSSRSALRLRLDGRGALVALTAAFLPLTAFLTIARLVSGAMRGGAEGPCTGSSTWAPAGSLCDVEAT